MAESILLKQNPRIEFKFQTDGFQLIDSQNNKNSGFYPYSEFQSIELNKLWFPRISSFLRYFSWILNMGVPYFPDGESYKKANLIMHFKQTKLGIWLTDTQMADQARHIKRLLDKKLVA